MKKLLLLLTLLLTSIGCRNQHTTLPYEETIIEKDSADEHGVYRTIYREYPYLYSKVSYLMETIDSTHYKGLFINEFGDTVQINYIDTKNFPRREE